MTELNLQGITAKQNVNQDIVITIKLEEFLSSLSSAPQLHDGTVVAVCLRHLQPVNGFTHKRPRVAMKEASTRA